MARSWSAERERAAFASLDDFKRRVGLTKEELRTLAELGALNCFAEHRRAAMWRVEETAPEPLFAVVAGVGTPVGQRRPGRRAGVIDPGYNMPLPPMTMPERVKADYDAMNLTTGPHPMKLLAAAFAEYLARHRSRLRPPRCHDSDCRECDLPSAARDSERLCLCQPRG